MNIQENDRGIEVVTPVYRVLLHREGGYAIREVELTGVGRLDRFDRPGEGPHPTCMYFDNLTVNYTHQFGYYGKMNRDVGATVDGHSVNLKGMLLPIVDEAPGRVVVAKTMHFEEDAYDAQVEITFEATGGIDYVSVWWDVNDRWLKAMRSSAGVFMPLRAGFGDSYNEQLGLSWRSMREMQRGPVSGWK